MAKLLPIILLIIGTGLGGGAGIMLKPESEACNEEPCDKEDQVEHTEETEVNDDPSYVAMKNQFVVPVIRDELVQSLVVLSLSLETLPDNAELVFSKEPKLRDVFLRVLFDHAHRGGFNGAFTESGRLSVLRVALLEAATNVVGSSVSDILITDIVRQEM